MEEIRPVYSGIGPGIDDWPSIGIVKRDRRGQPESQAASLSDLNAVRA